MIRVDHSSLLKVNKFILLKGCCYWWQGFIFKFIYFIFFSTKDCTRKMSKGTVKVWGDGSGQIKINGKDITYFYDVYHREQVS